MSKIMKKRKEGKGSGLSESLKRQQLEQLAAFRDTQLRKNPRLRLLFIEMTELCNEHCRHCGSHCGDYREERRLSGEEIKGFLDQVKADFDLSEIQLCITGGEPLLREDFFEIMAHANRLGFSWGMTTNGTLITENAAKKYLMGACFAHSAEQSLIFPMKRSRLLHLKLLIVLPKFM